MLHSLVDFDWSTVRPSEFDHCLLRIFCCDTYRISTDNFLEWNIGHFMASMLN